MDKAKKDISILAIGDRSDYDSYHKFNQEKDLFLDYGFDYLTTDYRKFLNGGVPRIKSEKIIIFLFFPFSYWGKQVEHKKYKGIYGNRTFHKKLVSFWNRVEKKVKKNFAGKEILFINNLSSCGVCRDKLAVAQKLSMFGVSQPRLHAITDITSLQAMLSRGHKFFLKPRYGSMGKGITFLNQSNWQTNFTFRNNRIISRKSDYGWKFSDVTGNHKFLEQLLKKDILVQEAVDPLILNGNKIDLRIYTFLNKVIYVYPRKNKPDKITTNISQGGQGAPGLLKKLPRALIARAKREAIRVSEALNITLGGIDIVPSRNLKDVYVIDVNVFSGFPKRKTFNFARNIAGELKQARQKRRLRFKFN